MPEPIAGTPRPAALWAQIAPAARRLLLAGLPRSVAQGALVVDFTLYLFFFWRLFKGCAAS